MADRLTRALTGLGLARSVEPVPVTPDDGTTGDLIPSRAAAPRYVSPDDALTLPGVFRALMVLATTAEQASIDVWRGGELLSPRPSLADRPDPDATAPAFIGETVVSLASRGNAFWRVYRDEKHAVIGLTVLDPRRVYAYRDRNHRARFDIDGRTYTPTEVTHLKLLRLPGTVLGLGPIQAAMTAVRGHLDVLSYGAGWFADTPRADTILKTDATLTPDQAKAWRDAWDQSRRESRTAVLGNGLNVTYEHLNPSEAQWLDSQKYGTTEIARLFGIPARLMMAALDGSSLTYSNAAQEDVNFVKYTMMRYFREIETQFSNLLPRGQRARMNVDAILRADITTRYAAHSRAIQSGFLTVAEVREIENLPALTPAKDTQNAN